MDDQRTQDNDKNKDQKRGSEGAGSATSAKSGPDQNGGQTQDQSRGQLAGVVGDQLAGVVSDTMNQAGTMARNVSDQALSAASNVGSTAQDLARRVRERGPDAVYEQGARATEYLTRNVNDYPLAALVIAGAVGYGLAFLMHTNWGSSDDGQAGRNTNRRRRD